MKNYYFTFGFDHCNNDGTAMKDYWVRVTSDNHGKARQTFIDEFTTKEMQRPMQFATSYDEDEFDKSFFPAGEYTSIESND